MFRVESGNVAKDVDVATSLFNEIVADLAKNKLQYDIKVHSGSIDFVVTITVDLVKQIVADPAGAAVFTSVLSGVVGGITQKIIDQKDFVKNVRESRAWMFLAKLKRTTNENKFTQLPSVEAGNEIINFSMKKMNGEIVRLKYEYTRDEPVDSISDSGSDNGGLHDLLLTQRAKLKLGDLILLALRPRNPLTASEIKDTLANWGRPQGQSFYASGTINSLIKRGLVARAFRSTGKGTTQYSLTDEGEIRAEEIVDDLVRLHYKRPPFVLQRIVDRGVRKIRLMYVQRNLERVQIYFNGDPLFWDGESRQVKTIGAGGGGNVVIPRAIFRKNALVTVNYDRHSHVVKYANLTEANP
jgi:hypothetical protein